MKNNIESTTTSTLRVITDRPPRVYAVGDIHGCFDELQILVSYLKTSEGVGANDLVIFIGDYIDRGDKSKEVIEYLVQLKREWPKTVFIKGNHEDMLLDFLGFGGDSGDVYLDNGGAEFLKSYGLNLFSPPSEVLKALPPEHLEFLKNLEVGVVLAEFVFVHAGVRPGVDLAAQNPRDLMWIRGDFVHAEHNVGKTVVFGHTPFEDVFLNLPYKIGIDTGVVFGNTLSIVELVHGSLFQVGRGESKVKRFDLKDRLGG
jgi:serine/threonine protein phosphatase 1